MYLQLSVSIEEQLEPTMAVVFKDAMRQKDVSEIRYEKL
jgi:hypothetical protein